MQSPSDGEALTVKVDRMLKHEFSVNVNTGALPEAGKAGVILEYIDDRNYVTAGTNYATNEFELRKVVDGQEEIMAVAPTARDTIYGHSNYDADAGGTVDGNGTIRVEVDHFTKFAVFAYEPAAMTDMAHHWADSYVHRLAGMKAAVGYPDGSFRPDETVSRSEFAKMLASALGLEAASRSTGFSDDGDIPPWAQPSIGQAMSAGILNGYEDGTFRAGQAMTRAEAAAVIFKLLDVLGI